MSNFVSMPIDEISLQATQIRPVMSCLIHTVIFMRALGVQAPRDVELEMLGITYAAINSKELDQVIAQNLDKFIKSLPATTTPSTPKRPQTHLLNLKFSTTLSQKADSWWKQQQKNVWESWEFKIRVVDEEVDKDVLRKDVEQRIKLIVNMAQKRTQQIPSLADIEKMRFKCFDFEFEYSTEGNSGFFSVVGNFFGKKGG